MKPISKKQKFWAILGAGLLVAAASGSALAMQSAEKGDWRPAEIQQEGKPLTITSPLPEPENEVEFTGPVEAMSTDMWVVGGRTLVVTAATEIKAGLAIGTLAKVQAVQQADGSLLAREIEAAGNDEQSNSNSNDNGNANSNDNMGNDDNSNNDHDSGNVNSNDDNGNDNHSNGNVNSNDHGGNDDHSSGNVNSNDNNGSDNHGGNVNSNEDNGGDNHDSSNVNSNDNHTSNQHSGDGNAADDQSHNDRGSHSHSD